VAVGEDYNIFLLSRVEEERRTRGPVQGVVSALTRTGRIISTCGFIMAGSFAALFAGSFLAMKELGFALAVGVLLDTLVVRPILVPAFLILLQGRGTGPTESDSRAVGRAQSVAE
jgi:putative drug exporter of the RND superfamily